MNQDHHDRRAGFGFGLGAYLVWGVLPLYFKQLAAVPPIEIVANRILWSLIFLALLVTPWRRRASVRAALAPVRILLILTLTAALIAVNWLLYVRAVVQRHGVETSLGYY